MKKLIITCLCALIGLCVHSQTQYINPFIGTQGMGHTFPGACVPHGGVQLSPETDTIPHSVDGVYQKEVYKYCAGYQYDDTTIVGFSHTHFSGTGHSDLGDILLMPTTGKIQLNPGTKSNPTLGYRSTFRHENETASPGYYSVLLDEYQVKAELTTTERVGVHRYTYPKGEGNLILDLNHGIYNYDGKTLWSGICVESDTLVTGFRMTNGWARMNLIYFAISFSHPILRYESKDTSKRSLYGGFWRKFDVQHNFPEMEGRELKAGFVFDLSDGRSLEIKVAISAVDKEGALLNLKKETQGKNFDKVLAEAKSKWNKAVSSISVNGTEEVKELFYTSLYRTLIHPSVYMDVDGRYRGIDHSIHNAEHFTNYTIFSLWDTFRALHPLINLIDANKSKDMMESIMAHQGQSIHKALPVWSHMGNENWCMIGYHGVSLLSDAFAKGIPMDGKKALEAMVQSSNLTYYDGLGSYIEKGYVPLNENVSSASISLEYSYDDWTIYRMALMAGNAELANQYKQRAYNYQKSFLNGYARPRYKDGRWKEDFNIYETHGQGFIEGNSLNYSFFVPHDVKGMINLMGGDKAFIRRLDNLFGSSLDPSYYAHTEDVTKEGILGGYIHGNEPSHHIPYLYMWTSQPWKTSENIYKIIDKMYNTRIDGLCGNDDCGQMSAWYIFTALGFYPVCPGSDEYIFGLPQIQQAEISLKAGKKLKIQVCNQSEENKYIQAIYWNGERYTKRFISHHTLIEGGNLIYEMGNKPAETCFDKYSLPYSLSSEDNHRIIPAVQEQQVYASNLNLSSGYHIVLQDNRLENERLWLKKYLQNDFQLIENSQGKTIRLILQSSSEQKEDEYQIDIQDEVKIISPSARGIFYGIQTLRQLMITTAGQCSLPQLAIKDRPYYPWRAYMLDESRVFQGKEAVKSILDEMARLKMNIFHWHLTDDQGWRIEIKKYPKLCQIGARRDSTQLNGWKGNSFDGKVHEGYYTQKEIKEIIEYAQSLHIQIIPEIEMPGHSSAVIAAYPEFGTTKKQIKVPCSFGVQYEVLDVSSQKVIQFLHDVLDEVIALFPSPIIHIGGDEVKYDQWNASVAISNYIKKLGVANPAELQIEFTNAISEWLKGRNKHMMGGDKAFIRRLDNLFGSSLDPSYYAHTEDVTKEGILGGYIHGNEPSHHIPYLYMWTSQPWKTSENIYKIIDKMYNTRIDGLCGNDDCGQMSAWYIFTALGFYPVCPGSDEYIFGLPQIQQAEISLKAGKKLKIQVCNQSEENKYIQAIYWNGERYTKRFISHHTLIEGGNLIYEMGNKPAETCFDKYSLPYSLSSEDNHRIIPAVQEQQVYASNLNLSSGYHIVLQDNRLENERLWLKKYLQNDFQLIENSQGKTIRLILQSSSEQKEDEYQIDIQDEVKIISPSARGIFYGIQTLRQLMITTAGQCSLPQLAIKDRPYYPWRAYMLDESRVFQGKEAVKSILDEMARLKMNIFHWHLTDDQGWRIEIKKYPKLCQIGARRDSTQLNGWKGNSFDGKVHEGYYTQKEIKEIIEYAQSLHIQIIPEIEMPGHSSAVIAAYPEFGTTKKQIKVPCSFGVQYEVLDVSSQKVIQFLHDVLDEVIALFPSPIIHIGGDEVKYDQWNASVAISNYIKKLGVANPAELQIEFTNAISEWLKGRNKHMMGWNDIMGNKIHEYNSAEDAIALKSKLAEGTIVQFWKGDLDLIEETAQKGYDIVNSYHYGTYLDYDKSRIPLAKSYAFNPIPAGMDKSLQYKILGLGCQMWGEQILTVESMNRMTFPRIAAYAEIGWVSPARKNYMEFLPALMRLVKFNKHYETGER